MNLINSRPGVHAGRAAAVALALAAGSVFVWDPFGFDRWVLAKELVFIAAAVVACWAVPQGAVPRWMRWWFVAGFSVLFVGAMTGSAPLAQVFGRWPRYEGVVTLSCYVLAVVVGARLLGGTGAKKANTRLARTNVFLAALAISMALTAVVGALEMFGIHLISTDLARPGSLLGNASDLGVVGAVGVALFLPRAPWLRARGPAAAPVGKAGTTTASRSTNATRSATPQPSMRVAAGTVVLAWVGPVASLVVVAVSGSRGAFLAMGAVLIGYAVMVCAPSRRAIRARWLVTVGAFAAAAVVLLVLIPGATRVVSDTGVAAASAANRLPLWGDTLQLLAARPVVGAGPNGFADAITTHLGETWFADVGVGSWIESPHDLVLQVGAAGGALGLACFAVLVLGCGRMLGRHGSAGGFGVGGPMAIASAAIALLFHFTSPGPMLLVCLLIGATFSVDAVRVGRARWPAAAALGAWACALLLAIVADHAMGAAMGDLNAGRVSDADAEFASAASLRPWDADVPLMAAEAEASFISSRGTAAAAPHARSWIDEAVARLPGSTRALKAQAVIAQFSGDLPGAVHALTTAAQLAPTDPQVFHRLGGLEVLQGQTAVGVQNLEHAQRLAPRDADITKTLEWARSLIGPR